MTAAAYRHRHTVTFDETNLVGNVYFAHFAHWQGHCREHFLAEHAPGVVSALNSGLALVTVSCELEFYAEVRALDVVDVAMRLTGTQANRISMSFDYIRVAAGPGTPAADEPELIARGNQTVAVMVRGGDGLRPARFPPELAAALSRYDSGARAR